MTNSEFKQYIKENKIQPYEDNLINRLRDINYNGVPLSLIVLCFDACNTNCYLISVNLTSGMDSFKLIHGDINICPQSSYPNHSWVECDNFVYDPTDGFKYEKDLYYKLYEAKVSKVYDEISCKDYVFYKEVLKQYGEVNLSFLPIFLQYLEEEENRKNTINHNLLLNEINEIRKKYNITKKYDEQVMNEYRNLLNR